MALTITPAQLATVQTFAAAGDYVGGWYYLASVGDKYADNAHAITSGTATGLDKGMELLVKNNWDNAAGAGAYEEHFGTVAKQHFKQYVRYIDPVSGKLPDSKQIEKSYRDATSAVDLPPEVCIDGNITRAFGDTLDKLWPGSKSEGLDWPDGLRMEDERQVESDVFNDLDPYKSGVILIKDLIKTVEDLIGMGLDDAADAWRPLEKAASDAYIKARMTIGDAIEGIDETVSILFKGAQDFIQRSDPLILDLDGDGLETRGNFDRYDPKDPVYFDHDLNGAKESTGWVMPDDGFLVLDRNGNGVIDNGAELFGNHTPLSGGGTAADGFAALVQEDTNADGKVDNTDARFADLRVWRDLNQDGISEASELTTLADNNIAYLYVAKTEHLQSIANGNQIADLGTYVKTDSSTGGLGETHRMADVNLVADPFRRQFITSITPETAALPDMRGSGAVRDLREAEKDVVWVKAA